MLKFFITDNGSNTETTITQKELEKKMGFQYVDETVLANGFKLPPYNLANLLSDIMLRSEFMKKYKCLSDPLSYLKIHFDPKIGWGIKARTTIPSNTVIMNYAGVVNYLSSSDGRDDYEMAVSLPYFSYWQMLKNISRYTGLITSKQQGNLSRLLAHMPEQKHLPSRLADLEDVATENVKPFCVFDEKSRKPMIFMVSTREIKPNEPVGCDYGEEVYFRGTKIKIAYLTKQGQSFYLSDTYGFFSRSIHARPEDPYGPYADVYCDPDDEFTQRGCEIYRQSHPCKKS